MYSVEDLLISHGYKLPRHAASSTPTPVPASSSARQPPSSSPPSYSKHHEILENRSGTRTVNGYERGPASAMGNSGGTRQPQVYVGGCPSNNNEPREGSQPKRDGENRGQTDTHSLGESLTSDSGFCDGNRGPQPQSKDVSYWRRRGQDFSVLLDYADIREPHGKGQGGYSRPEGPQQARGQEVSVEDRQRAAQERQRWAAHAQAQALAQTQGRSREREAALQQWRMATERKCQSLGTEEWHPAVSFGRQMSQSEAERWGQEQQRLHARTPEGMVVHPRTKAKSQSLPRVLQPESLQYVDIALSGKEMFRRVNGHPLTHQDFYRAPRWPENGRPASANQLSITPKARFTRPPRPPSYEMHQQIRGSCEILSGRESVTPMARDRTPIPTSRSKDPQLDYFAQDSGPPGYIPPPSYKRAPIMGGAFRGYGDVPFEYRYRGDMYPQVQVAPDGSHWFIRHPACSWPGPHRDRSSSSQKQLYPVYSTQEHSGGGVQYISFDDPRIRHISSALGGNSLTDADKIRHIRNELPSVTVSEPAPDDSAFLPPPLGPFVSAKLAGENNQTSSSNVDNENKRWRSDLHKDSISNFRAPDQNCNNRHLNTLPSPSSPSSAFQLPLTRTFSRQGSSSDQVFAETITQVKTIVPQSGQEIQRNTKRRVSETIFCLVSVPVHTPTNINKGLAADQNNNEAMPNLTVTNTDTFAVGLKESPNIRSKSVNEIPIKSHYSHYHTTSTSSMRNYKRAPLRKEVIDAWVLQANEDKELGYGGSWPGNQYRNQETQTGSPVTGFKSPETQSPTKRQEALHSASDTTMDSASSYGYPMTGQKNLHLSSNSAFSRLSLSPTQTESLQHTQQDSSSPTKTHNQGEHQLSSPKKSSPPESEEQLVFGQFLLKPVNRRPCDAIGELETINKEMEDTISKRPNVSRFKNDSVDERLACFKSGEHFTGGPEPGREAISLPPMHIERPNNIKKRSKSFASSADLESMEMRGTFSKPQANNIPLTSKQSPLPKPTRSNNFLLSFVPPCSDSNHLYRQDIPVPQESLLRDVGLTVYTETPGGPGEPMQRSLSVPSPLNHKDHSQSMTALVRSSGIFEHNSREELDRNLKGHSKSDLSPYGGESKVCGIDRESCISPEKGNLLHTTRRTMEVSCAFRDDDNDERYALSEPLTYKNDSTIADKHLESLLIQEKANTLPTEDLSNLYEVKFAKGIPENESIEERAARILGITVPVEALCVEDKQSDDDEPEIDTALVDKELSSNEETQQVTRAIVQVQERSLIVQGPDMEEIKETGSRVVQEEEDRLKHTNDHNDGQQNQDTETPSVLDIPEFPPSKLPLSLPVTPDKTLSLSICSGEKKGRGGTCKLIESLQDKLNCSAASSAAASTGLTTDRMARLKELDSVSRIRRLSLKTPEPVQEPESKVVEDLTMKVCNETRENVAQQGVDKEEQEEKRKISQEEESQDECVNLKKFEEPKEVADEICREEQRHLEVVHDMTDETGQKASIEINEEHFKHEAEERMMKLRIVEDVENTSENVPEALVCTAETTKHAEEGKLPIPKQRTKLQKPPLLPKPRSVPKREITLPLSFSTGTCGTSDVEDEEMLSVSDSYDPSRVERV